MAGSLFQARLRIRIGKHLDSDDAVLYVEIGGRQVKISSGVQAGQSLSKANWLVFKAGGFADEIEAHEFGSRLKKIVQTAGVSCFLGVDLGNDQLGAWIDENFARSAGFLQAHERTHPNVHGLVVLEDDPDIRFFAFRAEGNVLASSDDFVTALRELATSTENITVRTSNALRLVNQAILNPQALAQLVLAISAVEALGQGEKWTANQKVLLRQLKSEAAYSSESCELERTEVVEALDRIHRIGIRQGVKRVLARLGLTHLLKEWDRIYNARSQIFHGSKYLNEVETAELAAEAVRLCGHVILVSAERDGLVFPSIVSSWRSVKRSA